MNEVTRIDRRGAPPGSRGNIPHVRNEAAAQQIETLSGMGLPRHQISIAIEAGFKDQGYSPDTLERHYRAELDRGMVVAKTLLLQGAYDIALGRNVPEGVSPDRAYAERSRKINDLLNSVHGVVPSQNRRLSGPDGGPIEHQHRFDLRGLSDEELDELERLRSRIALIGPGDHSGEGAPGA